MSLRICVISFVYPTKKFPQEGVFVKKMIDKWSEFDHKIHVIVPITLKGFIRNNFLLRENSSHEYRVTRKILFLLPLINDKNFKNNSFFCFGGFQSLFRFYNKICRRYNRKLLDLFCSKLVSNFEYEYDVFYGKFLSQGGLIISRIKDLNVRGKSFVDIGESSNWLIGSLKESVIELNINLNHFNLFFSVSERNKKILLESGIDSSRILTYHNTVSEDFKNMDKAACRKILNLPIEMFIVIFIGYFEERKGPNRIIEALNRLSLPIGAIFIGYGEKLNFYSNILFQGVVENHNIPYFLNSSDLMIAPSTSEGNSNSINEAIACGTPLITSDIPEIRSQISVDGSILINPIDIDELSQAISYLYHNKNILIKMSENNLNFWKAIKGISRAEKILNDITK